MNIWITLANHLTTLLLTLRHIALKIFIEPTPLITHINFVIPRANDSRLLEVYRLQDIHLIAHKVEIRTANLTRHLKILNLCRVLAVSLNRCLQSASLVEVNDIVLLRLAAIAIEVGNPVNNGR